MLGDVITQVSGQPYHVYLKEKVLDPLNMTRTIVAKENGLPDDHTLAYGILDNGEPYNVPLPGSITSGPMGSAGGLLSTTNDLSKYCKALMKAWRAQEQRGLVNNNEQLSGEVLPISDVPWLFAPLQIMDTPSFREKSYASGWGRSQLPAAVGGIGVNPGMVDKMSILAEGILKGSRLALWHQGKSGRCNRFCHATPRDRICGGSPHEYYGLQ